MKIGIWCDYNQTLGPSEGIGVFVDSLARGLLDADPHCQLVMKCNARDWQVLAPLANDYQGRVSLQSGHAAKFIDRKLMKAFGKLDIKLRGKRATKKLNAFGRFAHSTVIRLRDFFEGRVSQSQSPVIDLCDVWLIPYVGLQLKFTRPSVVVVHDLVCCHFPEMMTTKQLERFMDGVRRLVGNSTLTASMSRYICKTDIQGILGVEDAKIRVLRSAIPDDIKKLAERKTLVEVANPEPLKNSRYLFYPAAFRSYKNHELLVETLRQLHLRGERDWKVVFTGISDPPDDLVECIRRANLQEHVVVLGKVDREELCRLYRGAFATVVPSRYEQGSFPIMEALALKCPAISSDIPSLREQFFAMGDAMLYARTDSTQDVVEAIDQIQNDREGVIRAQQLGFERMRSYTWKQSAVDWLKVFEEAISIANGSVDLDSGSGREEGWPNRDSSLDYREKAYKNAS